MEIAVIGGGIAGLTTAYRLSKQGIKVTVLEKDSHLGGQLATFNAGGVPLEKFYHHIFRGDKDVLGLIDELGLGTKMDWIPSKVAFYYGGRTYKFVTPGDLLRFKPLGITDRLRLGLATMYLQRLQNWKKLESTTAKEWIIKYAGRKNYDVIWGPLLQSKFGEKAGEVGMPWFWGRIYVRLGSRTKGMSREVLGYMKGSFGQITAELQRRLLDGGARMMLSTPVNKIGAKEGKVCCVETPGGRLPFDAVVSTAGSDSFAQMAPGLPEDYVNKLKTVTYQGAQCLVLVLKNQLTQSYWLNIGDQSIPFLAVVEHTNFIPPEVYGGRHIVYLPRYINADSPPFSVTKEALLKEYLPFLTRFNPEFRPDWVQESFLFTERSAQPVVPVNYSRFIPPHQTPISGLFLANTTQIYPEDRGINYSVRLGNKVASLIAPPLS